MIPRQGAEKIALNHRSPAPPTQGRPFTPPPHPQTNTQPFKDAILQIRSNLSTHLIANFLWRYCDIINYTGTEKGEARFFIFVEILPIHFVGNFADVYNKYNSGALKRTFKTFISTFKVSLDRKFKK